MIREGEIIVVKGAVKAIGSVDGEDFFNTKVKFKKGDQMYLFSDGYPDQFGGSKSKKLKSSGLKKLLLTMQGQSGKEQQRGLEQFIDNWQGSIEQLDDICMIGVNF